MNDTEKLTVVQVIIRLLVAIENSDKPIHFRLRLPPKFGEMEERLRKNALLFEARQAALKRAVTDARALVDRLQP